MSWCHTNSAAECPLCTLEESHGVGGKGLGWEEIPHGTREQGRKYGRRFGEHHLFTWVVFEAVYIAASVTVQGSETDACKKKKKKREGHPT